MFVEGLKTYWELKRALASSRWPEGKWRQLQEKQLRRLLVHAYSEVPLYRKLYDEAGFRPDEFLTLDDLEKIPILEKKRLRAAAPEELTPRGVEPSRCSSYTTSGTTGTPLRIYCQEAEERWHRVVGLRILLEHGMRWRDRVLEVSFSFGDDVWLQKFGIHRKDWLSLRDPPESWVKCLMEHQHQVIVTYGSALHALAEAVAALGVEPTPPRLIVSLSETLTPTTRRLVKRVLGTDPVDVFGMVELSNFAWECEERSGFHVSADSYIVEVRAAAGEAGPMIVTGLGAWTLPMIRYDTGDVAELALQPCACGRRLPLLRRMFGRAFDTVLLPNGRRLFWNFFFEILSDYDEVRQWRVVQDAENHVTVQLALRQDDPGLIERVRTQLRETIGEEVQLTVERHEEISRTPGEKVRLVTSRIES